MHTLFITEKKDQFARAIVSDHHYTDMFFTHPLTSEQINLLQEGAKTNRRCAVIATPEETEGLPKEALDNLQEYVHPSPERLALFGQARSGKSVCLSQEAAARILDNCSSKIKIGRVQL